jgi:hypothetical protein
VPFIAILYCKIDLVGLLTMLQRIDLTILGHGGGIELPISGLASFEEVADRSRTDHEGLHDMRLKLAVESKLASWLVTSAINIWLAAKPSVDVFQARWSYWCWSYLEKEKRLPHLPKR